ncbi:hypothetical protein RCL_jg21055.t1 [Rhizophagus clarus]|uniref:Uncharacterized protein n=1 Tax=Rhizophagus clarus TaxID=94130 RepID=A0A8H3MAU1_9GLOM|nr:hypothetical protein RCL_jg21055.t1 [Rhizophagus clarus]
MGRSRAQELDYENKTHSGGNNINSSRFYNLHTNVTELLSSLITKGNVLIQFAGTWCYFSSVISIKSLKNLLANSA